jgi:hypothetical protein
MAAVNPLDRALFQASGGVALGANGLRLVLDGILLAIRRHPHVFDGGNQRPHQGRNFGAVESISHGRHWRAGGIEGSLQLDLSMKACDDLDNLKKTSPGLSKAGCRSGDKNAREVNRFSNCGHCKVVGIARAGCK